MILTPELIKLRLKKLGIRPDKHLGQHFLIDQAVLDTITNAAKEVVGVDDAILEVGPGLGVLTSELIALGNQVVAVEKDPIFARHLTAALNSPPNLRVIEGNVLDEIRQPEKLSFDSWAVVANIPYAITSPLLRGLLRMPNPPHHILVLVQKESAQRITAQPRDSSRGLLTVEIEMKAEATLLETIPPEAFWPAPDVESGLLRLALRDKPLVSASDVPQVLKVAAAGFSAKRKQLRNSLRGSLHINANEIEAKLQQVGIEQTRRAETLSLEEWQKLTHILQKSV